MNKGRRTGILGGTFDPVHVGHLDAAEAALRALDLDDLFLLPALVPPHRAAQPRASSYHRFAMVALAAMTRRDLAASDLELQSPGPSYTAATLDRLAGAGYSGSQLFFITGADAFAEIATWKDYPGLLERCHFVVVARPGFPVERLPASLPSLASRMIRVGDAGAGRAPNSESPAIFLINAPTSDVSASEIRRRIAAREPFTDLVPACVEGYIRRHGLYSPEPTADQLHG